MKRIYAYFGILIILIVSSCTDDNDRQAIRDIAYYQGIWRNVIDTESDIYHEELSIKNSSMDYVLVNTATNVIVDQQKGMLVVGNNNTIEWSCTSSISNEYIQTYWKVRDLNHDNLCLFSDVSGMHKYKKVYRTILEEKAFFDTLSVLTTYSDYLPTSKDCIEKVFGRTSVTENEQSVSYKIHHPLVESISFYIDSETDSVFSYSLKLAANENVSDKLSDSLFHIRTVSDCFEYCDGKSLTDASYVVQLDTLDRTVTYSTLKKYDYWYDVSKYIGWTTDQMKAEFSDYIYKYYQSETSTEYHYETLFGGKCKYVLFNVNNDGKVTASAVQLLSKYDNEIVILYLLKAKYYYDRFENGSYYFYPNINKEASSYVIRYNTSNKYIIYNSII